MSVIEIHVTRLEGEPPPLKPPPLDSVRIVMSVSGGKDSTAMALHLRRELGLENVQAVFCDTGWEHPATYDYLRDELDPAIGPITWLRSPEGGMVDWIRSKKTFPSRLRRWCTERLKVLPIREHILGLAADDDPRPVVNAVGVRAQESRRRAKLPEWEPWGMDGRWPLDCVVWRPLIDWTEAQVIDIHQRHGIPPNPLYLMGATRVGCWPCIHSRKREIALIAETDPGRIDLIRRLEVEVEAGARERARLRSEKPWPDLGDDPDGELAAVERELRDPDSPRQARGFFQGGPARNGVMHIDDIVAWSRTERGGRQMPLFDDLLDNAARDGCMRWGMCEVDTA